MAECRFCRACGRFQACSPPCLPSPVLRQAEFATFSGSAATGDTAGVGSDTEASAEGACFSSRQARVAAGRMQPGRLSSFFCLPAQSVAVLLPSKGWLSFEHCTALRWDLCKKQGSRWPAETAPSFRLDPSYPFVSEVTLLLRALLLCQAHRFLDGEIHFLGTLRIGVLRHRRTQQSCDGMQSPAAARLLTPHRRPAPLPLFSLPGPVTTPSSANHFL